MTIYVTLTFRDNVDDLTKKFDSRGEAIEWLKKDAFPRYGYQIAHIHVDQTL